MKKEKIIIGIFGTFSFLKKTKWKETEGNITVRYSNNTMEKVEVSEEEIKQALYDVGNLPINCGLASKEDNEILAQLLDEYNSKLSKDFYWQIETYRNY